MTETRLPMTPAEAASATLAAIEADREALDMAFWMGYTAHGPLLPEEVPSACGTTLCMAGWIAHATGWTVHPGGLAVRDTVARQTADVAEEVLQLNVWQGSRLWFGTASHALMQLRRIADGLPFALEADSA